MEIIYFLIPLSIILVAMIAWSFLWSVKSGQFDDLEGQGHRILFDDDTDDAVSQKLSIEVPKDRGKNNANER